MHRTGEIKPTENVVRAFLTYMRTFKKKQALDELVPLIDIYAHALTPKGLTKTGVMLHGNLVRFVKEWLNTKKGRHVTLVAKQGGKVDGVLRAIKTFTSLRDLALNIPVSIFTELGEQVSTYQLLGKIRFVLGKWRHQTKQGKKIVSEHTAFIGKNPWTELIEPAKDIGDRLMEGIFIMFKDASVRANKTFLLGSLTKKEFNSGIINTKRLAELKTELGRYRTFHGAASILGSTPEGKSYSQYKTWALPILSTTVQNLKNLSVSLLNKSIPLSEKKKSLRELYRIIEVTAFMAIMFNLIADKDEDKNSFAGRMVRKAWDEANTLIHAIQPRMFMAMGRTASFVEELGENLTLIIQGEKYKTTKKLKGLEKLKRQFKPVAISQFQTKKKKEKKEEPMAPGELDFEGLDFDGLDLGAIDIPELDFSGVEF